jgi:hypothetical protein
MLKNTREEYLFPQPHQGVHQGEIDRHFEPERVLIQIALYQALALLYSWC